MIDPILKQFKGITETKNRISANFKANILIDQTTESVMLKWKRMVVIIHRLFYWPVMWQWMKMTVSGWWVRGRGVLII